MVFLLGREEEGGERRGGEGMGRGGRDSRHLV